MNGVILLRAVDAIPDIFMTAANVTEDLSVATIVSRFTRGEAPLPAAATESIPVVES